MTYSWISKPLIRTTCERPVIAGTTTNSNKPRWGSDDRVFKAVIRYGKKCSLNLPLRNNHQKRRCDRYLE
ncbi:hypothetical protein MICAG_3500012 [Microcystis aeruginosa PCC 9808]|uniref:Uncharacterized protein n=1 Tax=Microcystis aeruginosa PCC 9808 TaxID=1160284 RepID=I4HZJ6_MICAE|nr:hypothetical protein MICAG_3500012 [Microcystis aeruginosa PCC 9808]